MKNTVANIILVTCLMLTLTSCYDEEKTEYKHSHHDYDNVKNYKLDLDFNQPITQHYHGYKKKECINGYPNLWMISLDNCYYKLLFQKDNEYFVTSHALSCEYSNRYGNSEGMLMMEIENNRRFKKRKAIKEITLVAVVSKRKDIEHVRNLLKCFYYKEEKSFLNVEPTHFYFIKDNVVAYMDSENYKKWMQEHSDTKIIKLR